VKHRTNDYSKINLTFCGLNLKLVATTHLPNIQKDAYNDICPIELVPLLDRKLKEKFSGLQIAQILEADRLASNLNKGTIIMESIQLFSCFSPFLVLNFPSFTLL
jgi:hypothetical protein